MNKLLPIFILCFTLFASQNLSAQKKATDVTKEEVEFKPGDIELSLGVGVLSTFTSRNAKTRILPITMMANYRIKQFISVGAYAAFSSTNGYDTENIYDEIPDEGPVLRNDFYMVGGRLEGHFNRDRMDFYGGAMISYNKSFITTELEPGDPMPENIEIEKGWSNGGFKYSGYVGMKYMMTKHLGLFGEIGYGASIINLGLTSKF